MIEQYVNRDINSEPGCYWMSVKVCGARAHGDDSAQCTCRVCLVCLSAAVW